MRARLGRRQQPVADPGSEQHGHEPRDHQRQADHPENRVGVFARARLGEPDRHEARRRDQGAGQHREGGRGVGVGRCFHAAEALLELYHHHLDGDDGVVDQQAERDDQGAERDALEIDAEQHHADESDRQHQRHRQGHDDAGAESQAEERHDQNDAERLGQRLGEFVHRFVDHLGLVGDAMHRDADRQVAFDFRHHRFERLAEDLHVAAGLHHDAETDHRLAVEAHRELAGIAVAAFHLRHIAQRKGPAGSTERQCQELLGRGRRAVDPDRHALALGLDRAGGGDGVLLAHHVEDLVDRHAQHGEPRVAELDVDLLVLHAEQVGLGHLGHAEQPKSGLLDHRLDLGVGEAVGLEGPDQAVGVAVFIVEVGAEHALRQGGLDVADLLAHLIPELGHLGRRDVVAERDVDHRLAGLGVALHVVEVGQLLQLGLELVGDLQLHLARGGAGPCSRHDHLLDGEGRVLAAAEIEVGEHAGRRQHDHEEERERAVLERQLGQVGTAGAHLARFRQDRLHLLAGLELVHACGRHDVTVPDAGGDQRGLVAPARDGRRDGARRCWLPCRPPRRRAPCPAGRWRSAGPRPAAPASGRAKVSVAVMPMPMKAGGSTMVKRAG